MEFNLESPIQNAVLFDLIPSRLLYTIYNYHISSMLISSTDTHRDLGVIISADLQLKPHYQHIVSKS